MNFQFILFTDELDELFYQYEQICSIRSDVVLHLLKL